MCGNTAYRTENTILQMASTSLIASHSLPPKKYDVFISFRGEDTRGDFTSHLHAALCRNKIETYIDYRIEKGHEVWAELEKAIKDSTLFLVIFSENYASSTWCLNELLEIMDCRKFEDVDVIPVFYKIEPSHVRKQTKSYETAFTKHKKDSKLSKERIHKWKDALCQAANLSGFDSHGYRTEPDLIEDIIKLVLRKLDLKYTNEFRGLFISDENFSHIESLFRIDSRDVQIIGIWGMGGIGKTSLATAIFHKVSSQYEGSCFLENLREESERFGLNSMYNKLVSKLLKEDPQIDTPKLIPSIIMRRLGNKKVLIVLDDVNTSELLESLVGVRHNWLGAGSKVIVTTRDKHVLTCGGVNEIHEVKKMNFPNSLKLFSLYAFNRTYPEKEYEKLSKRAIAYAQGNPLALKVLGSFLCSRSENEWDSALAKLKKIPNPEIQKVLRLSYDELDVNDKNVFLDIACFFKGDKREKVTKILNACDFFADIGIRNLLDKALITIHVKDSVEGYSRIQENCIEMHDLIQEMGREIVRDESIRSPGRRSRLWNPEEVYDVLTNNKGTDVVEGIMLDLTQIKETNLSTKAFKRMPNLRILVFKVVNQDLKIINPVFRPKDLESLPENLRYLVWDGYPLNSLPSTFSPEMLVELSLPNSNVKKLWDGVQNLPSLEAINLGSCEGLIELPDLSGAPNLKQVILWKCKSLAHVDLSMLSLQKLEVLNVGECRSLKRLSINTLSPSMRDLHAWGCLNLEEFSVTSMPTIPSATHLNLTLGWSGLSELPSSILHIKDLNTFTFPISECLMDLPENFASDIRLTESTRYKHDSFITLHILLRTSGFRYLRRLAFINCCYLSQLPDDISLLSSLEDLALSYCTSLISLPESLKYLPRLEILYVSDCVRLRFIPALPPSIEWFNSINSCSLQTMLTTTSEPSIKQDYTFLLPNSIKLDQNSYDAIFIDAIVRIEIGAKLLSILVLEDKNGGDDGLDMFERSLIFYFLPARMDKLQDWFHYHCTQDLVTIELPPNLLGIVFYMVISQDQLCRFVYKSFGSIAYGGSFGCECYLETSCGERINVTSIFGGKSISVLSDNEPGFISDHVFLWYDAQCCKQIMEAIEERKTINDNNRNFTFKFFARTDDGGEAVIAAVIKECGFRWIYPSENQIVEEEGECESKSCNEIHELEASAVHNKVEDSDPDEQDEFEILSNSNLEVEGTEDLRRHLLEQLLHIGFGGELMQ